MVKRKKGSSIEVASICKVFYFLICLIKHAFVVIIIFVSIAVQYIIIDMRDIPLPPPGLQGDTLLFALGF